MTRIMLVMRIMVMRLMSTIMIMVMTMIMGVLMAAIIRLEGRRELDALEPEFCDQLLDVRSLL